MTRLEAYKEAARRSGDPPGRIEFLFAKAFIEGIIPEGYNEEIPAGEEEAFILRNMEIKEAMKNPPPHITARLQAKLERMRNSN